MQPLTSGTGLAINTLILIAGITLIAGGATLITSGARLRRRAAAKRVSLVRPDAPGQTALARRRAQASRGVLVRPAGQPLPGPLQREAARRLARLGVPAHYLAAVYAALRGLSALLLGGLTLVLLSGRLIAMSGSHLLPWLLAGALGAVGWILPQFILGRLVKRNANAAADGLPDALELLVVCVEAGLSLEDSIDRIIGELEQSQPALATELALTSADLKILPSRDQALANLAERVDVPSVHSVVSTLSQTLRYGTPLAQAMRVVAADMRTEALIKLEERANRLPAIMTVPMMLFIMPTIFLIVGGPAMISLLDIMRNR